MTRRRVTGTVVVLVAALTAACSSTTDEAKPGPATSAVGSTTTTRPVPTLDHAIDLGAASAFGFGPAFGTSPDDVLAALRPTLGLPARDTGWYVTPVHATSGGEEDCLGGKNQRILRWGSLSYAFWKQEEPPGYTLWSWTLGDSNAAGRGDRREPLPIVETPVVAATTGDGMGVGTKLAVLQARYGSRVTVSDDRQLASLHVSDDSTPLFVSVDDGMVTGIGATLSFC